MRRLALSQRDPSWLSAPLLALEIGRVVLRTHPTVMRKFRICAHRPAHARKRFALRYHMLGFPIHLGPFHQRSERKPKAFYPSPSR